LIAPLLSFAQQFKILTQLNTDARETNLSITPNGKYLFFMTQRGEMPWSTERKNKQKDGKTPQYDGDIWYSVKKDGEWQPPKNMSELINTADGEDEPNVTVDGQAVYFQSWRDNWSTTGGPYYKAELNGAVWKNPVGLGDEITRFFEEKNIVAQKVFNKELKEKKLYDTYLVLMKENREDWREELESKGMNMDHYKLGTDGMAISPDQKTFVVSAFDPTKKKYDLFISHQDGDGRWPYPRPLDINTEHEEISVFIAGDNKTMYFASDKPGGNGGLDIYKTTLTGGTSCGPVENLGPPYNTEKDEYGFIVSSTENQGFMIVDGDIVQIDLDEDVSPDVLVINGRVVDGEGNPLEASVKLMNTETNETINITKTNTYTGEYSFSSAREEGSFNQIATTPDGLTGEAAFKVDRYTEKELNFVIVIEKPVQSKANIVDALNKGQLQKGEIFRIDKLYFDANKATIKGESYELLDEVSDILSEKTKIVVEVGGHTNSLPPDDFCDKLSTDRAKAVYDYLVSKGIPEDRLAFRGYGKRNPIESNATLQGRKINQRVEIKILDIRD
ncbi:MAG: OmpA family protein, partial [Bacteroidota bacterium]